MNLQIFTTVDAQVLTVHFELRNQLNQDIYVHQYLPARTWPPARGGYVYVHRDGQVLLYLGTVPNPPRTCLAQEIRLYAELLPASQVLRGSISLPIPVVECGKLKGVDPDAPHEVVSVSRLRLVICYKPKQRRTEIREVVPASGLYEVWYADSKEVGATLNLLHPVEALRRSDDFDRPFEQTLAGPS